MEKKSIKKIQVLENGPYMVTGNIPLNRLRIIPDNEGGSIGYEEISKYPGQDTYYLCRCGGTHTKPYCDSSHYQGFNGLETASHATYQQMAGYLSGKTIDLMDAEELCAIARFCETYGTTWKLVTDSIEPRSAEIVKRQCANCPSGRLTPVTKEGTIIEPELPKEISIIEDEPSHVHGPIWAKGGIPVEDVKQEQYPVRNRVILCRCGNSRNKPFCDGSHMEHTGEI